jgi:hypothetical protein
MVEPNPVMLCSHQKCRLETGKINKQHECILLRRLQNIADLGPTLTMAPARMPTAMTAYTEAGFERINSIQSGQSIVLNIFTAVAVDRFRCGIAHR